MIEDDETVGRTGAVNTTQGVNTNDCYRRWS